MSISIQEPPSPRLAPPPPVERHKGSPSADQLRWLAAFAFPIFAGLAIRLIVSLVFFGQTEMHNDAADYYSEATKIYQGTREATPFYWPPGNTYYMAGWYTFFGNSLTATRLSMVFLSSLQIAIVGWLAYEATRSRRTAVIASWLWAVYPASVFLVFQPYSQHLAGFSLAAIALGGIRWMNTRSTFWIAFWGLSLGVGCLTRPSMMAVALASGLTVLLVAAWNDRKGIRRWLAGVPQAFVLTTACILIVGPTFYYNVKTGGGLVISTNNERNFFIGNNPYTPLYKTSHFAQRPINELPQDVQDYLKSMYSAPDRRLAMKQAAMDYIAKNPGATALRTFNRACSFWGFDYLASRVIRSTDGSKWVTLGVLIAEAGAYCAMMMLALIAIVFWSGHIRGAALVWYLVAVGAYAVPYFLAFSSGTYHFPVMGILIPLSAVGLSILMTAEWKQVFRSYWVWSVLLIFAAIQVEYAYFTLAALGNGSTEGSQVTMLD